MFDIDLSKISHHPVLTDLVSVLCNKTQNVDEGFFKTEVAYFLGKMASCMRATVITKDRGAIPINIYALGLATSGFGKGHSVGIIEEEFLSGFRQRFFEETLPIASEQNIATLASRRAARNGTEYADEEEKLKTEFRNAGSYPFTFDSGTVPAVKQLRHKLLLANAGSINLQIDEIGSNLIGSVELLNLFLELYDQGKVKQKLTKNTAENQRAEELEGKTPTNMLLFGHPNKLLDGGKTEDEFFSFLETGYARRCLFGFGQHRQTQEKLSATDTYNKLIAPCNNSNINKWANHFTNLADPALYGFKIQVEDAVGILLLEYKFHCEKLAAQWPEHEEIKKAEMSHRYFKALKLAGAYAFVDQSMEVTEEHLLSAIKLVEESGESFQTILNREKPYVKLARYIATVGQSVTHADLLDALPFYKSSSTARNEMMALATAYGYKNNILIKKTFVDNIELFTGETLKETSIDELMISYSQSMAYDYMPQTLTLQQLPELAKAEGYHWCNHKFKNKHRASENAITGFNVIVLDVDNSTSLDTFHKLFKNTTYMTYTTKRHTPQENRFRVIIPMKYVLHLEIEDYREFMKNILKWLPIVCDEASEQIAKKWASHGAAQCHINEAELFDPLNFIPRTTKNEIYKQQTQQLESMDNMERWFASQMIEGRRNVYMHRFAMTLKDCGLMYIEIEKKIKEFNKKLSNPLTDHEIDNTVLISVAKSMTI